ncbi:uncharacterized protein LOC110021674 [Phalaenopsis equestris]|uniref:uncharacterized protein LOC110021674 n=1 Tax=Phalaenopsis equestris TaxID=78828 RepID=UPI0009E32F98|nr:uncharacterized protein LOC110021674 [Phalaenopsis equestris]
MGSISSDYMKGRPYSSIPLEEENREHEEEDEEEEEGTSLIRNKVGNDYYADVLKEESEETECVTEFKPIAHPMEPLEEDQPTMFPDPMLNSSILSVREMTMMLSYFS